MDTKETKVDNYILVDFPNAFQDTEEKAKRSYKETEESKKLTEIIEGQCFCGGDLQIVHNVFLLV